MRRRANWKQGVFTPKNRDKYRGKTPIVYRSSWEFKLMCYADRNPNIVEWASESAIVHYSDPTRANSTHRYIIDFSLKGRNKEGKIEKIYVEVKPASQSRPPVKGRKSDKTFMIEQAVYARNQAKWAAAQAFAKQKGARFVVLTEESLG